MSEEGGPEHERGGGLHFDPRALVIALVAVAALLAYAVHHESELRAGRTPAALRTDERGLDALSASIGAEVLAFEDDDGVPIRVLVREEAPGDYVLVAYRRRGDAFERFGQTWFPTGFDRPRIAGDPPRLEMRERGTGAVLVMRIEGDEVDLVARDGDVEMVELPAPVPP
ncbi:hypothetical protein [Sandaracinus amylolyticus]|uniref:Uncharacterized protein n=1 Tax=Sandaracinus amylolyticus TaxID=927083 RepID=A0A0F6YJ25_9BACT|nr:hypothetical protein [Sandaracinus amylolyticus]AKF06857.1 hypothetical protein DB32_004006 [Sandaracinus amylolyticus]